MIFHSIDEICIVLFSVVSCSIDRQLMSIWHHWSAS